MHKTTRIPGVYAIWNTISNEVYVGATTNLANRFTWHRHMLRRRQHLSPKLLESWWLYGEDAFEFKVLVFCERRFLPRYEVFFLARVKLLNDRGATWCHSVDTKRKISQAAKSIGADPIEQLRRAERATQQHREGRFK